MRFKPTIKGMITLLLGLVFVVITIMAASAVSEFSISGFSEWDSSVVSSFSANITGYPYLTPYTAAEYLFEWNTNDNIGTNHGTLSGYTLNDGTISGATTGVSGQYGEGVSFDGTNDGITIGSGIDSYLRPNTEFTVSLWANHFYNVAGTKYMFSNGVGATANRFGIANGFDGEIKVNDYGTFIDTNYRPSDNEEIYITYVKYNDSGIFKYIIYANGISIASGTSGTGYAAQTFYLGSLAGASDYYNGTLDEIRVWNKALNQSEIQAEMNSHFPVETPVLSYSFEAYNATHVFDTNWNTQGQNEAETGAISFDGTDDYMSFGTNNLINDSATWSFWLYKNDNGASDAYIGKYNTGGNQRSYMILASSGGTVIRTLISSTGTGVSKDDTCLSCTVGLNDWTHVAVVFEGGTALRYYIDGVSVENDTTSIPTNIYQGTAENRLGITQTSGNPFDGSLSEVQIFDRALNSDEVTYLYDNSKATYELSTTDGTLETQIPNSSPHTYNISVAATNYFPQAFTNQNVSSNLSVQFNQSVITFDSFEKFTNNSLSSTYTVTHNDYADGGYYNNGRNWGSASPLTRTWTSGMSFVVNDDYLKLKSATVDVSENGATKAYLLLGDYNGTILETTTNRSGNIFYFTYNNNLLKGQEYTILANNDGNSWDISYESGSTLPESFDKFNWSYSYDDGNTARTDIIVIWEFLNFSKYDGKNSWTITENETINLPVNTGWNVTASTGSYYDKTATFNVTALDNKTENVTGLFDTYFNVSAKDSFNNNSINNFNLSITSSIFNQSYEVTNYELIEALTGYSYTASAISTSNFLLGTDTKNPTTNLELWVLFLDPYNSVNITFREYDDTIINTTTINITIIDGTTATNYNTTNGTLQLRLLTPNDYELRTTASGYNDRKYYFTVTNDSTQNINIYLEENVSTELQQIRILDTTNTEVTGAIVRVEKETTLGSNLWSNYAEETTNAEGIANTYLEKGINNYYRFAVFVNGAVIPIYPSGADYTVKTNFISGVTEIVDIVINLQAVEITDYYDELYSVSTNMGFVGNDTVWFSWVDAQNTISGAKLVIRGKYIDNTTAWETINTQTSSATSGNITYTFTPINNTIYQAYGYIIYSDRESLAQTATKSYGVTSFVEKNTGLLLAVLILAVTAFLTVSFGVLLSGVMTVLMLVFTNIIGLTNFPTTIITSLLALFIILLIRITKGDEG